MTVSQREIVEVNFPLPGNIFKPHPVVVLSNNDINSYEEAFVGVMLSSIDSDDEYSFWLEDKMLTKKPRKKLKLDVI